MNLSTTGIISQFRTRITIETDRRKCTVEFNEDLSESLDAFIVAIQGIGYHKDSIIGNLIEFADMHNDNTQLTTKNNAATD